LVEIDSFAHLGASFAIFAVNLEELNAKDAKEPQSYAKENEAASGAKLVIRWRTTALSGSGVIMHFWRLLSSS
jgi:hypothetical protein